MARKQRAEVAKSFGAIAANAAAGWSTQSSADRPAHIPASALIEYAIVKNGAGGTINVLGETGEVPLGAGERKQVAFPSGAWTIRIRNGTTAVNADEVVVDIGLVWEGR